MAAVDHVRPLAGRYLPSSEACRPGEPDADFRIENGKAHCLPSLNLPKARACPIDLRLVRRGVCAADTVIAVDRGGGGGQLGGL